MLMSATALVLSAISAPAVGDVTPVSLAVRPPLISLTGAPYDWRLQQGGGAKGLSVADGTAQLQHGDGADQQRPGPRARLRLRLIAPTASRSAPMLLLLTNSLDGTADVLVGLCAERGQPVFRFNIDLWASYRFAWTPDGFAFADPSGRVAASQAITACLWRRPSLRETAGWVGGDPNAREATEAELHALMREIAEWARARRLLRLIEPNGPRRVGRLAQMRVAREFFAVPDWSVGWGVRLPAGPAHGQAPHHRTAWAPSATARSTFSRSTPRACRPIGRGSPRRSRRERATRPRSMSREESSPSKWSKPAPSSASRTGARASAPMPTSGGHGRRRPASPRESTPTMRRLGLRYGRLDFLSGDGEPTFLEVNPNGQFGWLDDPAGWPLHRAVLDAALDPSSTLNDETIREASAPPPAQSSVSTGG